MPERRCHHCHAPSSPEVELRPYGPGGAFVCFPCATATPEREAQTAAAFGALLDANSAVSPSGVVAIGAQDEPRPFNPEEAAERLATGTRPRTEEAHTVDVGHVHVLAEPGGSCTPSCPHPDHRTEGETTDG